MPLRVGSWLRGVNGLIRLRGLIGIHLTAQVAVRGTFVFGTRVSIGRNSIIQVPAGSKLSFGNGVYIGREVEVSPQSAITIGNFTTVQNHCHLLGEVTIGANCLLAPNVIMSSGTHQFMERPAWLIRDQDALVADPTYHPTQPRHLPIHVHDDCWIGINAVVMRGVTIGRGCVIGANSVVTDSIEPYSVIAGAPARLIRRRFAFRPPSAISSAAPDDLPYFYSGFDLRQRAISSTGWKAHGRFQLALHCEGARGILVQVEATEPAVLHCAQQKQVLAHGLQIVTFTLEGCAKDGLIAIEARDVRDRPCTVSIRGARLEI
jgi:acetyltransferase-like isoleucine patch superfamily enzyme